MIPYDLIFSSTPYKVLDVPGVFFFAGDVPGVARLSPNQMLY
jgi:hypothetical protein